MCFKVYLVLDQVFGCDGLVGVVWMLFGASFSSFYGCICRTVGFGFKRTQGPGDQETRAPRDQGTRGPGDQRRNLNDCSSNFILFSQGPSFFFQHHPRLIPIKKTMGFGGVFRQSHETWWFVSLLPEKNDNHCISWGYSHIVRDHGRCRLWFVYIWVIYMVNYEIYEGPFLKFRGPDKFQALRQAYCRTLREVWCSGRGFSGSEKGVSYTYQDEQL